MITSVRLADGEFQFRAQQARLILEALFFVATNDTPSEVLLVQLGVPRAELESFSDELGRTTAAAERAQRDGETGQATRVRVEAGRAHLMYAALVASTLRTGSEEEYNIRVGFFKEHALALAQGIVAAAEKNTG